jgi:hypothetical protein
MKKIAGLTVRPIETASVIRALFVIVATVFCLLSVAAPVSALALLINDFGDLGDADLDDPACATAEGNCTLRAAIEQISYTAAPSNSIALSPILPLPARILLGSNLPNITSSIAIEGPGSDLLTIDGQDLYRIFAINSQGDNSTLAISGLRLVRGLASPWEGGAVYAGEGHELSLTRMVLEDNNAATSGGAVSCYYCGTLSISYSRFSNNTAPYLGGGVFAEGAAVNVVHSVFEGNTGSADFNGGGGMTLFSGSCTITDSVFESNRAMADGGGLYFAGAAADTLTVLDSLFTGNNAGNVGGGIYLGDTGSSILERVTVSGNSAHDGGGIFLSNQPVSIANSTISGNSSLCQGGGIEAFSAVSLSNVTVTDNITDTDQATYDYCQGGGVFVDTPGTLTVQNSIIAGNVSLNPSLSDGSDCYNSGGAVSSGGYNVIGNGDGCIFAETGDQTGDAGSPLDPLLDAITWNGGPTPTHALMSASPAVNNGDIGGCTWDDDADGGTSEIALTEDQRTADRPSGGRCDVGSYEWSHCDNGVQDAGEGETGIDCGGNCAACSCPGTNARILTAGFPTIQGAYDDITIWDGALIRARETDTGEDLTFDRAMYVALRGGHDCDFFRIKGMTAVASLTISAGRLTVENIVVGP